MESEPSFGGWLKKRLKALGLSYRELGDLVGYSPETIKKIVAGERTFSPETAEKLVEALHIAEPERAIVIKTALGNPEAFDQLKHPTRDLLNRIPCPYKGLDVFEEEDADLFFGRERLVEDLVRRVKESRTVFIIGPSGSGKSSLVRAGLIPGLRRGDIKNSDRWLYGTLKPGRDPIGELARVISGMAETTKAGDEVRANAATDESILARWCEIALKDVRDKRAVLFVDQFEEIFTQVSNEEERRTFLNLLIHAATAENGRAILLFAMRSDFVMNCVMYEKLNDLFNQQSIQIGAMKANELASAVEGPALSVDLPIEPKLIARIIDDMQDEPGALPLMQFALKDLFDSRQAKGGTIELTLSDYQKHGGIHESLERHADSSFAKLQANEQELARSIFIGLIEIGRGTQDTRRMALFDELIPMGSNAVDLRVVLQKLVDARLITTDEQGGKDTITISHEKLIDAWPWLKNLVEENREMIALRNAITSDAKEWDDHQRELSYLYTGVRLANVGEQLKAKKLVLSDLAQTFIDSSQQAEKTELSQEERRRQKELDDARRLAEAETKRAEIEKQRAQEQTRSAIKLRQGRVYLIAASGVVVLMAIIAGVFGVTNSNLAEANASVAETAQAVSVLAVTQQAIAQANAEDAQKQAYRALAGKLAAQGQSISANRNSKQMIAVLLAIQSMKLLPSGEAAQILLNNNFAAQSVARMTHNGGVGLVAFSPDGLYVVSASYDSYDTTARVWEVSTGNEVARMTHESDVHSIAFSPDGRYVVSGSLDDMARLWELARARKLLA